MQPATAAEYRALRQAGWPAQQAWRGAKRTTPDELTERAAAVLDTLGAPAHRWTQDNYAMAAQLTYDDDPSIVAENYGAFTNDAGPDTVPNPRAYERHTYKHFRPEYSIEQRYQDNRAAGMTRAIARERAIADAENDAAMAVDAYAAVLTVTASRAGVELGAASVGGIDMTDSRTIPYPIARRLNVEYIAEMLRDLTGEAIGEAEKNRPRVAAALA